MSDIKSAVPKKSLHRHWWPAIKVVIAVGAMTTAAHWIVDQGKAPKQVARASSKPVAWKEPPSIPSWKEPLMTGSVR